MIFIVLARLSASTLLWTKRVASLEMAHRLIFQVFLTFLYFYFTLHAMVLQSFPTFHHGRL